MGTSSYSMADIASLTQSAAVAKAEKSTSRSGNTELTMTDFLQLMVVQLQNQTMDDTMDTSEMMNQMVQMQMVTAITNLNELSVMTYAGSLVGKLVTIGIVNGANLEEREVYVTGTGLSNGQQVIFCSDGNTYALNQIMAIGRLPDVEEPEKPGEGEGEGAEGSDKVEGAGDGDVTDPEQGGGSEVQPPVDQSQGADPTYNGEQGAPSEDNT